MAFIPVGAERTYQVVDLGRRQDIRQALRRERCCPLPRGLSSGSARIRARRWPRSATRLNRVLHPFDHPCNEEGDPRPLSGFNAQSPVEGSMTVDTRVTVFAGNPPQRACSRMMSSSGATYTQ